MIKRSAMLSLSLSLSSSFVWTSSVVILDPLLTHSPVAYLVPLTGAASDGAGPETQLAHHHFYFYFYMEVVDRRESLT